MQGKQITRVIFAVAAVVLILLCGQARPASPGRYEVSVHPSLERLAIKACFEGKVPEALVAESDEARLYLDSVHVADRALQPVGGSINLQDVADNSCIEYQVNLQPAQSIVQSGGPETRSVGANMLTAIGDWLWRPLGAEATLELRFRLPAGIAVSAPWPSETDSDGMQVYFVGATPYNWPGVVAFGRFVARDIEVPGAVLHVAVLAAQTTARQAELEKWVESTARNVTLLYGRFPVTAVQVIVSPTPRGRGPVPWAYVSRGGGPAVHLFINQTRPIEDFARDWSLTHEMSHLFLPYVAARDAWLFEGLPTYLQNILMARGGAISEQEAWQRLQAGFYRGARTSPELSLARATERIARDGNYLRVYWGGAAMMLTADLQLRSRTDGKQSLDTALEQLARCCAAQTRRWNAEEILARLDEITGTTVFQDLVRAQFAAEGFPDYEMVLARAGVKLDGEKLELQPSAPWAPAREALMRKTVH